MKKYLIQIAIYSLLISSMTTIYALTFDHSRSPNKNFTTIEEADDNCPLLRTIYYDSFRKKVYGTDWMGHVFTQSRTTENAKPKNVDATGHILEIQFGLIDGYYGGIRSRENFSYTFCNYYYPATHGYAFIQLHHEWNPPRA